MTFVTFWKITIGLFHTLILLISYVFKTQDAEWLIRKKVCNNCYNRSNTWLSWIIMIRDKRHYTFDSASSTYPVWNTSCWLAELNILCRLAHLNIWISVLICVCIQSAREPLRYPHSVLICVCIQSAREPLRYPHSVMICVCIQSAREPLRFPIGMWTITLPTYNSGLSCMHVWPTACARGVWLRPNLCVRGSKFNGEARGTRPIFHAPITREPLGFSTWLFWDIWSLSPSA